MREGCVLKTLGDLFSIGSSKRVYESQWRTKGVPFYRAREIVRLSRDGYVDNELFIDEELYVELSSKYGIPKAGDIMVTGVGTLGICYIVKENDRFYFKDGNTLWFKTKEVTNPQYVQYAFKSEFLRRQIDNCVGATVGTFTIERANKTTIPVPSFEEQERIVAELDLLTGIIDKQKQQLKELDTLAQSIFYDMFGRPDANEREWTMKTLAEIGTIVSGSTPSTSDESNWDGDVNWVTPAELGVQLFYGETRRKITSKAAKSLTIMPIGTILMSSRAPIGKLAITSVPMCCNQGFKNIVCGNNVNNIYLYYCLMLNMNSIKAMGRGATFKEVSKQAVSSFEVMLPPMNLQEAFAQKIQSIESQKESINRSLAESQKLFDYTMDKYFG